VARQKEWCRFCIRCLIDLNYTFSETPGSHEHKSSLCHDVGVILVIRGRLKAGNRLLIFQYILELSILIRFVIFRPIRVCYFFLVFKQNLCSLRDTFSFNKNIRDFSLNSSGFWKSLFDRFVACNLSVYLLGLVLGKPCFRSMSCMLVFQHLIINKLGVIWLYHTLFFG